MIDSSEKCIGWLNLELQSPDVIERCSKDTFLCGSVYFKHPIVLHPVMILQNLLCSTQPFVIVAGWYVSCQEYLCFGHINPFIDIELTPTLAIAV